MAYARLSGQSDVYVFHDSQTYVCCGCGLESNPYHRCKTAEDMFNHLQKHIDKGDKVPEHCLTRLQLDMESQR